MLPDSILPTPEDDVARILRDYERRLSHLETLEAAGALTLIEDFDLLAPAANFDFQNISGAFKHLKLIAYLRSDRAAAVSDETVITFNNDGGANYDSIRILIFHNAQLVTVEDLAATSIRPGAVVATIGPADAFDAAIFEIPNYAGTVGEKVLTANISRKEAESTGNLRYESARGWWRNTAAITRVTLAPNLGANWLTGSVASLYGFG